ncbi:MAG: hypothetical protein EA382_15785 [Spirochaetaceae bacterium]|nr:MAG: hypothetical protein EA382_15785 [Spirochaetaceae bacterium]
MPVRKIQQNFVPEVLCEQQRALLAAGTEDEQNIFRQFAPEFYDLIVIDKWHRGSAAVDSTWRAILEYFSAATHIGLTDTPKQTRKVSNSDYFGEPVYTCSLKQGIEDGFLAPYKVVRVDFDRDLQGWRPTRGQTDKYGEHVRLITSAIGRPVSFRSQPPLQLSP